jgi:hypothetical protein
LRLWLLLDSQWSGTPFVALDSLFSSVVELMVVYAALNWFFVSEVLTCRSRF